MPLKHSKNINKMFSDLKRFSERDLPRVVGVLAQNHFKANFKKEGFVDGSLKKWPKRKKSDRNERQNRAILTKTGRLRRSIQYKVIGRGKTQVFSADVPYAEIHNEGGEIKGRQNVRSHRRGRSTVRGFSREVNITIPKRQFMGNSKKLNKEIERQLITRIRKILKP